MSDLGRIEGELGGLLGPPPLGSSTPLTRRQAVVTAVTPPTLSIDLGGTVIPGVGCLGSYAPVVGDVVWVIVDGFDLLVAGRMADPWHIVGNAGEPAFQNTWTSTGYTVKFRKLNGVVYVTGQITMGTTGTTMFTLPVGYRPGGFMRFASNAYNGTAEVHAMLQLDVDGLLKHGVGPLNGWTTLDPVQFIAER